LIADAPVAEFVTQGSGGHVVVRSPRGGDLASLLAANGAAVTAGPDGGLSITGLDSGRIGDLAAAHRIALHELTPRHAPLQAAYMELTRDHARLPGRAPRPRRKGAWTMPRTGPAVTAAARARPARARDLLASEWIKLRSIRSTYLVLAFAAAAAVIIGYLVTHADVGHWPTMSPRAGASFDPAYDSFTGLRLAQLAFR